MSLHRKGIHSIEEGQRYVHSYRKLIDASGLTEQRALTVGR